MNVLSKERIAKLRCALEEGLSVRAAGRRAGISRRAATRWSKILAIKKKERIEKLTLNISDETKRCLATEGKTMHLSATMFAGLLLETVAEENLFAAILDV